VLATAVAIALAGCTASGGVHGTQHHSPVVTSTPAQSVAAPASRIPLKCSQFSNVLALDQVLGSGILVSNFQQPYQLNSYIYQQAGALRCAWSNSYSDFAENSTAYLIVTVTPDVTDAEWAKWSASLGGGSQHGLYGAGSLSSCVVSPNGAICRLNMRVGPTWLSVAVRSQTPATVALTPLLKTAARVVTSAAVTAPKWSDPSAVPVPSGMFPLSDAQLATIAGSPVARAASGPSIQDGTLWGSEESVGDQAGTWNTASGDYTIQLEVLPSGSWAWSRIASKNASQSAFAHVANVGQAAIYYTSTRGAAVASVVEAIAGHNLFVVQVTPRSAGASAAHELAQKLATALASAIGG
jgi:hypothetical protein